MKRGTYILVVGPSGSGKNTLIRAACEAIPGLKVAISATTRAMREGEADGVSYHFLTTPEFMRRVDAGAFLEWAEYGGNLYGTLRAEIDPAIDAGQVILSDIEL
ncbi:MAG: guanylate kinase, partial [Patescibacteria group bacterium]